MTITAKYPGTCLKCGQPIRVGDRIGWLRGVGAGHTECPARDESGAPYRLSGGSGYGCDGWTEGQTLRVNRESPRYRNWPEYVTVVRASQRWIAEDGMSFGLGDEQGYKYSADCREATPEEIAPVKAKIEEKAVRRTATEKLTEIANQIQAEGEQPDGVQVPEGETIQFPGRPQNIYGGGEWFVLGPEWIWHVRNNGHDGDCWEHNNVRTGGAGAIGCRMERTEEMESEIRELA